MAPTSTNKRLKSIAKVAQGFVYCVARTGVTGAKTNFGIELDKFLTHCRQFTDLPLGVGFGISSKKDIEFLKDKADFAIIGSQMIRILENKGIKEVGKFVKKLKI